MIVVGLGLVFVRIATMILTVPILGDRLVPVWIKLVIAALITLSVGPIILETTEFDWTKVVESQGLVEAIFTNATTGFAIGLGSLIILSAAQMIGTSLGQLSGFQWIPSAITESPDSPIEKFTMLIATTAFILIGGVELSLSTILDTFTACPIGNGLVDDDTISTISKLLAMSFELTVKGIAPAIITLVSTTLAIAMFGRMLPQINLLSIGIQGNMVILILTLLFSIGGITGLVLEPFDSNINFLSSFSEPIADQHSNVATEDMR